jgi:L-malate glycosyltransferase
VKVVLSGPFETASFRKSLGLHLYGAPPGVSQTPINVLGAELVRRGHEVHAITSDATVVEPIKAEAGNLTLHFLPVRKRARHRALDLFSLEIKSIEESIRSIQPDVVHAHWTYEHAEAAIRSKYPHLITMHDSPWSVLWNYRNAYRFCRLLMALRTVPRVKALTVVSPYLMPHARACGYLGSIEAVPNGIELASSSPESFAREQRRAPLIVTVGDTSRLKNVIASVEAFRLIREQQPQAQLHLFGPGLTQEYTNGEPGIFGHGAVEHAELMRFFDQSAVLLIHPSLEESFGVVLIEAMVRGVPCLGGRNSGGVPFVFGKELASFLVDVTKPLHIASAALRLLRDDVQYQEISQQVAQRALRSFSVSAVADRYLELYGRILKK